MRRKSLLDKNRTLIEASYQMTMDQAMGQYYKCQEFNLSEVYLLIYLLLLFLVKLARTPSFIILHSEMKTEKALLIQRITSY